MHAYRIFSCGEIGHISRDCAQAATEIHGEPGPVAAPGLQPDASVLVPVAPAQVAI